MMAKESAGMPGPAASLDGLIAEATRAGGNGERALPPVHLWNPPFCGDIDMRIARDGTWFYGGTPIGRPALVRLFSSVLRRDEDRFVLVTPVEKVGITVEDAPFVAVELRRGSGDALALRTNVDEWIAVGPGHRLRFDPGPSGGLKPYLRVRGDLWALVARPVFYELVELAETRDVEGVATFGIPAGDVFFPMMPADELERLSGLADDRD